MNVDQNRDRSELPVVFVSPARHVAELELKFRLQAVKSQCIYALPQSSLTQSFWPHYGPGVAIL
jgi:hypothetical protein